LYLNGTYHLFYAANNNSFTRNILHATSPCTTLGLVKNHNQVIVNVFPNPFSIRTTIDFSNLKNKNYVLLLYDMQGRQIRAITDIKNKKVEIERENLNNGMYFFYLKSSGLVVVSGKLLIE